MKNLRPLMPKEDWVKQTEATLTMARTAIYDALIDLSELDQANTLDRRSRAKFIETIKGELELKLIVLKSLALRRVEGDD